MPHNYSSKWHVSLQNIHLYIFYSFIMCKHIFILTNHNAIHSSTCLKSYHASIFDTASNHQAWLPIARNEKQCKQSVDTTKMDKISESYDTRLSIHISTQIHSASNTQYWKTFNMKCNIENLIKSRKTIERKNYSISFDHICVIISLLFNRHLSLI